MIKHVLFDNDGTIVDSEIIAVRIMLRHLQAHGLEMDEQTYSKRFPGLLERDILHIARTEYKMVIPEDFMKGVHAEYWEEFDRSLCAIKGMDEVFRKVKLPKSMVSNGSVKHVERSLTKVQLREALDGEIFSAEHVERPKPFPDVYFHALKTLSLNPEDVLVVEDSPTGVQAARDAGVKVIGFLGASHVHDGHGENLLKSGANYLASNAAEVEGIFAKYGAI
jgi:HAD superfamily hydrolase (TIGR01509 family)